MYVTAEEFLDMLHEIRERYRDSHLNLDDPEVMHTLLRREFPEVQGVVPPPSYETIRQRYIPQEWRMLIPESRRNSPAISAIGPDEVVSTTDPVAEWCRQVVADLDSLRSDAFAAMSYVVQRSRGADSRTAMDRARATGQVIQMFIMFSRGGHRGNTPVRIGLDRASARHPSAACPAVYGTGACEQGQVHRNGL